MKKYNNRTKEPHYCITCGNEFYPIKQLVKNGGGKYCKRKCQLNQGGRSRAGKYWRIIVDKADKRIYMLEHRHVMEQSIGRKLEPSEIVHHINGDGTDNRLENLEIINRKDHIELHRKGLYKNLDYVALAKKNAIFTDEQVVDIVSKYKAVKSIVKVAKEYGVNKSTVWDIVRGKSYGWVEREALL